MGEYGFMVRAWNDDAENALPIACVDRGQADAMLQHAVRPNGGNYAHADLCERVGASNTFRVIGRADRPRRGVGITVHTATYAPWEEDADSRERIDESSEELVFDNARECADWLSREGFGVPSVSGPYDARTWLTENDPYEHPHTSVLAERSAHVHAGTDARLWAAIVHAVSRQWTRYAGPYYVERRNDFDIRV